MPKPCVHGRTRSGACRRPYQNRPCKSPKRRRYNTFLCEPELNKQAAEQAVRFLQAKKETRSRREAAAENAVRFMKNKNLTQASRAASKPMSRATSRRNFFLQESLKERSKQTLKAEKKSPYKFEKEDPKVAEALNYINNF